MTDIKKPKKQWCVVYRAGDLAAFTWHRTEPTPHESMAKTLRANLLRAGYHALWPQDYDRSMAIGLPETYSTEE